MDLTDDMERLADIADQVLQGTPVESFGLTAFERDFVLGYTRRAVADFFAFTHDE